MIIILKEGEVEVDPIVKEGIKITENKTEAN